MILFLAITMNMGKICRSYYNTVKNMIDVATKLGGALGNEAMKGTVEKYGD